MTIRCIIVSTVFACNLILLKAQDYSVTMIPEKLKENADCVIREFVREYDLQSINSGTQKVKKAITVLVKEGEPQASLYLTYDRNSSINIKQITLFEKNGKKLKSVKSSEISDSPAYEGSELYSDNRIKSYQPSYSEFPYTVEYIYEIKSKNNISYGVWRPYSSYSISLQNAQFVLRYPSSIIINRKELNNWEKKTQNEGSLKIDRWELHDLKALEQEPFNVSIIDRIPSIYIMPDSLIYDNYCGNARTWKGFGKWVFSLYKGKDQLDDTDKQRVKEILANDKDTLEIIRKLYYYLQGHTRYIAITMGLGGYQPYDAKTVAETGYGDCKALTNYMYSLLKEAGIKSYQALVSSGDYREKIFRDFPNFNQFDHVILSVPFRKDTIWLECTSQNIPFGFLGSFTDNRDVLLLTESGGKFAHTTGYDNNNVRICNSRIKVDISGSANWSSETTFHGLQYDKLSDVLVMSYDEQKKFLYRNSALPSLQILDFAVTNNKGILPFATIKESSVSKNYCSFSGKFIIMPLNLVNNQKPIQKMLKQRESDILINRSFTDYDTLRYVLPNNIKVETLPAGASFESKFGNYKSTVSKNGNEIIYTRRFEIKDGYYKPEDYPILFDFISSVSKADNLKTILTSN